MRPYWALKLAPILKCEPIELLPKIHASTLDGLLKDAPNEIKDRAKAAARAVIQAIIIAG